jgi:hypothetical protein
MVAAPLTPAAGGHYHREVISRITFLSNPRLIPASLLMPLSIAAGIALFLIFGLLIGIVALAAGVFFCYSMVKFLARQLASRVETGEDGIRFTFFGEETLTFPWEKIRLAGIAEEAGARKRLFAYSDDADRFVAIPDEFQGFDGLVAEVRSRTAFQEITLSSGETLKEKLKALLGQG